MTDLEGNVTERVPVPAAYISAAIKFLKDNDITVDQSSGRTDPLQDALNDIPDFDEDTQGMPYN